MLYPLNDLQFLITTNNVSVLSICTKIESSLRQFQEEKGHYRIYESMNFYKCIQMYKNAYKHVHLHVYTLTNRARYLECYTPNW